MSLGENIRRRRLERKLSQQELADALGYRSRSTIAKIEAGENDVSQKKLLKFAAVLGTTPQALLTGLPEVSAPPEDIPRSSERAAAVILAGGSTANNSQNIPTQFMNVLGKPLIVYCLEAYQAHPAIDDIYIVCLSGWENIVRAYATQYGITKLRALIDGGATGILSLKNAVDRICPRYAPRDLLIIQEATRPMVTAETLSMLLHSAARSGSATLCHSMNEYVQFDISGSKPRYVDRNAMIALQSPEAHRMALVQGVFQKAAARNHSLTESCCTMLLYHMGYEINFVKSPIHNVKIAGEADLAAFGALVK